MSGPRRLPASAVRALRRGTISPASAARRPMTDPDLIRGGQGHPTETVSRCAGGCLFAALALLAAVAIAIAVRA